MSVTCNCNGTACSMADGGFIFAALTLHFHYYPSLFFQQPQK